MSVSSCGTKILRNDQSCNIANVPHTDGEEPDWDFCSGSAQVNLSTTLNFSSFPQVVNCS